MNKRISCFFIYLIWFSIISYGQSNFVHRERCPIIPGSRSLSFQISNEALTNRNFEIWVFYSNEKSELRDISINSLFSPTLHRGRPLLFKFDNTYDCKFIFPSRNHNIAPNNTMFQLNYADAHIVRNNYPLYNPRLFLPGNPNIDLNPIVYKKDECVYYKIMKVRKSDATYSDAEVTELKSFVMPDSYNIAIAGDSYAAGEGAPNHNVGTSDDLWDNCPCHQSRKSGLLRGVKDFIYFNPNIDIDYSFNPCSGAKALELYENHQLTTGHLDCEEIRNNIQFKTLKNRLLGQGPSQGNHNKVNLLLLNIGGNDCGFAQIVLNYLVIPANYQYEDVNVRREYEERILLLGDIYQGLDEAANEFFGNPVVGICTYPDPTHGPNGLCGDSLFYDSDFSDFFHFGCASFETDILSSPTGEYKMIQESFLLPMNNQIRNTTNIGWKVIDVENKIGKHGICNCRDPYINTLGASIAIQGNVYGMIHPNDNGYSNIYRDAISDFVSSQFSYSQFLYHMGILIGIIKVKLCSSKDFQLRIPTFLYFYNNIPELKKDKRFNKILNLLENKEIRKIVDSGNEKALMKNKSYSNLLMDNKYISEIENYLIENHVLNKKKTEKKNINVNKDFGPYITNIIQENKAYLESEEFKNITEEIIKQNKTIPTFKKDPIDDLFKEDE
ncbi:MAG: hypothetical protein WAT71_02495 [Ignavibacteria bacterium]